jgi:2''-aminoglycoside nucleotidyltransferase
MNSIAQHIKAISQIFSLAEERNILIWLESGWAIDARLGKITREHEDIDIAFAQENEHEFNKLLDDLAYKDYEKTDYGFLIRRSEILVDAEPCIKRHDEYNFPDFPSGSCPLAKEGRIEGFELRCVSWEAIYYECLGYEALIPPDKWREKDFQSYEITKQHITPSRQTELEKLFNARQSRSNPAGI